MHRDVREAKNAELNLYSNSLWKNDSSVDLFKLQDKLPETYVLSMFRLIL